MGSVSFGVKFHKNLKNKNKMVPVSWKKKIIFFWGHI
jgi:hypothetical protein